MKIFLEKLWHTFFNKSFLMFVIIGAINTFNGTWISALFNLVCGANLAFVFGYIISLIIAYILNSVVNFHEKIEILRFLKFAISYVPNFTIQNSVVFFVHNLLLAPAILAYFIAAAIGVPITYLCVRLFAFSKRN